VEPRTPSLDDFDGAIALLGDEVRTVRVAWPEGSDPDEELVTDPSIWVYGVLVGSLEPGPPREAR
jgi:hypothetical protein